MSRAQMNTNKRRGAAQMRSTPSFTYSTFPSSLCPASDPEWQDAHPEFPRIVFHGLRHSSATYSMTALLELLKNAVPEVKAQLRLAPLT